MILGILSDTHGDAERTAAAVRVLQQVGADAFVHCGDIGGEPVLDALAGLRGWLIRGNTDCGDGVLTRYADALGLSLAENTPLRLELAGRQLAVFHGHESEFSHLIDELAENGAAPAPYSDLEFVLHGHTHVPADTRIGAVRIINPGALHRAPLHTVATLDLSGDALTYWQVEDEAPDGPPRRVELA